MVKTDQTNKIPKIIAIMNQKGGVGKTNVAFNLAGALAECGEKLLHRFGSAGKPFISFSDKIYELDYTITDLFMEESRDLSGYPLLKF